MNSLPGITMLVLVGLAGQAAATVIFSDSFDRSNSGTVGNGWSEVDGSNLSSHLVSGALVMDQSQVGPDTEDARIFRTGAIHSNILLGGTINVFMAGPFGDRLTSRVVVRSSGTDGSGTGPAPGNARTPCGSFSESPPDCWKGDGFGFNITTDRDAVGVAWLQIVDDGVELAATQFSFLNGTDYQWEMQINAENQVQVFVWSTSKPSVPTLDFTNGSALYAPISSGNYWQIEVANGNGQGNNHTHTTTWDDFTVSALPEPSLGLLLASGLTGLGLWCRRRQTSANRVSHGRRSTGHHGHLGHRFHKLP